MDCIFCKIVNKQNSAYVIYEDNRVMAFLDIYPAVKGHTLIIPKKHYENILDIDEETIADIAKVTKKLAGDYKSKLGFKAFDIVHSSGKEAGQTVMHFHFHLMPRKSGDGIRETEWWSVNEDAKDFEKILEMINR